MARFLSPEWFEQVDAAQAVVAPPGGPDALVVEVWVPDAPEGEVRYQVVVDDGHGTVLGPPRPLLSAQVRLESDYGTLAGIASGAITPVDALSSGRARLSGDVAALNGAGRSLGAVDLMPASVRSGTSFR